jgi:DNA replicative helicase MCM subunit Mcm2 (Cdc46/Mcm family)
MRPGDRVEVIGIYRTQGQKVKRNKNSLKAVFNTYIDLISFSVMEEDRYRAVLGDKNTVFSDE